MWRYQCGLQVCYGQIWKRLWSCIDIMHWYAALDYSTIFTRTVGMAVAQTMACAIYAICRRIRHNPFVVRMNAIGVCLNENTITCYFYRRYHIAGCLWNCIRLSCITQLFTHRVPKIAHTQYNMHTDCFLSTTCCLFNGGFEHSIFKRFFSVDFFVFFLSAWIRPFSLVSIFCGIICFLFLEFKMFTT